MKNKKLRGRVDRVFLGGLILAFSVGGAVGRAADPVKPFWEKGPVFLEKSSVTIDTVLAPPPAPHSKEDEADFTELLDAQAKRTADDCKRASYEKKVTLETFFGPAYGPLTESEIKKWSNFFDNEVRLDVGYFSKAAKSKWKRPRPYLTNAKLEPCVPREPTEAYPSGHAATSEAYARVLSLVDPKRKTEFEKRARQIARDRVIGGVHHPSDVEAGRALGDQVFEALQKNDRFKKELAELMAQKAQ